MSIIDTTQDARWIDICALDDAPVHQGFAALVDGDQVAIFRLDDTPHNGGTVALFAIGNHDPFSGANVIARGLIGSVQRRPFVASPIYKQRFDLATGECLDDATTYLPTWPVAVMNGRIVVRGKELDTAQS